MINISLLLIYKYLIKCIFILYITLIIHNWKGNILFNCSICQQTIILNSSLQFQSHHLSKNLGHFPID